MACVNDIRKGKTMKKIPTLFKRVYNNHRVVGISNIVYPGMEWVLEGKGKATIKWDGACCAIINGELYRRYDAKKGKKPPEGAIPCCDPDQITGHWPHWIKCDKDNPSDKWFIAAYDFTLLYCVEVLDDGTYEAVGKHFNGNPYELNSDRLIQHGVDIIYPTRTFNGIKEFLERNRCEGIVFWKDGEPKCKIKRTDFGFEWPVK